MANLASIVLSQSTSRQSRHSVMEESMHRSSIAQAAAPPPYQRNPGVRLPARAPFNQFRAHSWLCAMAFRVLTRQRRRPLKPPSPRGPTLPPSSTHAQFGFWRRSLEPATNQILGHMRRYLRGAGPARRAFVYIGGNDTRNARTAASTVKWPPRANELAGRFIAN